MKTLLAAIAVVSLAASAQAQCVPAGGPGLNGCGNSTPFGIPTIACAGSPTLGNGAFSVTGTTPCQTSVPVLLVGSCLPAPFPIPGPFGAGGFCGPSMAPCLAWLGPTIYAALPGLVSLPPNIWTFPIPIPNDPTIQGANACIQQANLCALVPGGPCLGVSSGISVTVI